MIDAREGVTNEFMDRLLGRTFVPPRGMDETSQREFIQDAKATVQRRLPRRERLELLSITDAARQRIVENHRTRAWPTINEIVSALGEVMNAGEFEAGKWPHKNSEYVVTSTEAWLRRFDEWPRYLEHEREVARELIDRGTFTAEQLLRAGLRDSATPTNQEPEAS